MSQVTTERRDGVALVTITNPPHALIDGETVPEFDEAIRELEADASVRAIVISGGIPGYFIRHYSARSSSTSSSPKTPSTSMTSMNSGDGDVRTTPGLR